MENKQDKGFTLVELLIVIVILGILATVTVFAVRGITKSATDNSCSVEKRALETAVEAYYVDNNQTLPDDLADLEPDYVKQAPAAADFTLGTDGTVDYVAGGKCLEAAP
jgi:general secretion pathway protein G